MFDDFDDYEKAQVLALVYGAAYHAGRSNRNADNAIAEAEKAVHHFSALMRRMEESR
jgi:hypothetical protein